MEKTNFSNLPSGQPCAYFDALSKRLGHLKGRLASLGTDRITPSAGTLRYPPLVVRATPYAGTPCYSSRWCSVLFIRLVLRANTPAGTP